MPIDPTIVFRGAGGTTPYDNANQQISLSRLAMDRTTRNIQDQREQVALQQEQRAQQFQQKLGELLADVQKHPENYRNQPAAMSPGEVAAQGGSPASPTGTSPSGTPTLKTPEQVPQDAGQAVPVSATASVAQPPPPVALAGSGMMPDYQVPEGQLYSQPAEAAPGATPLSQGTWEGDRPADVTGAAANAAQDQDLPPDASAAAPVSGMAAPQAATPIPAAPAAPAPQNAPAPAASPSNPINAIDWAPHVRDKLIAAGYGPEALQFEQAISKHVNDMRKQNADRSEAEMKAEIARHNQMAGDLDRFIKDNPTSIQPDKWAGFIAGQVRSGHLQPDEAANYQQYPGAGQLAALHTMLRGQTQSLEDSLKQQQTEEAKARATELNSPAAKAKRQADSDKAVAEADEKRRENDANYLTAAARRGAGDYAAAYNKLASVDPERAKQFDSPENFSEHTAENTMLAGLNSQQKAMYFERQISQASIQQNRDLIREQAEERIGLARQIHEDKMATGSAADRATYRQAQSEIEKLQGQERNLYPVISALRTQIQNAAAKKAYIDIGERGEPKGQPSTDTTSPTLDAMKQRYADLQEKAASIIGDKYDVLDKVGGKPVVSREQALANLHTQSGHKQTVAPPAQSQAAPVAAPVAQPAPAAPAPQKVAPPPASAPALHNFPADLAAKLVVGTPRTLNLAGGRTITVVKKADGNVYQQ